jgi:hypothetical protein
MTAIPTDPIDHSDRLAYESFLIKHLTDLDPDGRWTEHELYQRRQNHRYGGLTVREFDLLLCHLEDTIDALPNAAYTDWLTRHQQEKEDAQDPSNEPAPTAMA